jgi:type VI secretion system protein ImpJ
MSGGNRVAWREGLFLRPQHFQQQDRFVEQLVESRSAVLSPYPWGLTELKISADALQLGKFAVERLRGVLPDGTPIDSPGDAGVIPPFDIGPDVRDAVVCLTLPMRQAGAVEFHARDGAQISVRNLVEEDSVYDVYSSNQASEPVEVARPNLRFGITRDQLEGRVTLPLARVVEVQNGNRVILDDNFIPPCLDVRASPRLAGFLADIIGRAGQRVEELAVRAVDSAQGGAEGIASFMMLQALNRWTPLMRHQDSLAGLHPERLFETFVSMAGEFATLALDERRPPPFPAYDHASPEACFGPVVELLREELSMLFIKTAGQLPIEVRGPGAYSARIDDHSIFQNCDLYLAVSARAPAQQLMTQLPAMVKIGAVTKMPEIVSNGLEAGAPQGGLRIVPIPHAPPQIRMLPGLVYFELDRSSPDWRGLEKAPALGLHVPGQWADLRLELWWVLRVRR